MATPTRKPAARKPAARKKPRRKRVTVKVALFQCPKCKLKTNNPFKRFVHTCFRGFTPAQARAARANLAKAHKARKGGQS